MCLMLALTKTQRPFPFFTIHSLPRSGGSKANSNVNKVAYASKQAASV
jgi:hypothetical protein